MFANSRLASKIGVGFLLILGAIFWLSNHKSFGFSVSKITSSLPFHPEWETPLPSQEIKNTVLGQKYRYLSCGAQSYAFVSEDGKYVIKFFRMKHLARSSPEKQQKQEIDLHLNFNAYKMAFDELREESGLVYLHLNKTKDLQQILTVCDRLGRSHQIDLDGVEFVVQEKAELIFPYLAKLQDKKEVDRAIAAVLGLVQKRIEKGFVDEDKAVSHNYGFVEGRPIHLDIGRLARGTKEGEYERIQKRIEKWQQENLSSFSLQEISSNLPYNPQWGEVPLPDENIFDQKYRLLSEGAQAIAFVSEDDKYVIKFFKMRRFTPSWSDYLCPKLVQRRAKNLRWVFNGYKIAYDEFKEDSGLVYIHLNKTTALHKTLTLVDARGKEHLLDLDPTEFVVQRKAELIFSYLKKLQSPEEVQKAVTAVLDLVERRTDKGFCDRDKAVSNNYGFVEGRPIHLDVGRLYRGHKEGQKERIQRRIDRQLASE